MMWHNMKPTSSTGGRSSYYAISLIDGLSVTAAHHMPRSDRALPPTSRRPPPGDHPCGRARRKPPPLIDMWQFKQDAHAHGCVICCCAQPPFEDQPILLCLGLLEPLDQPIISKHLTILITWVPPQQVPSLPCPADACPRRA